MQTNSSPTQDSSPTFLRDKRGAKHIVIGGKKHWIPNTETREALGYDENRFPEDQKLLDSLDQGEPVTDAGDARLIRFKGSPNKVYAVFTSPKYEKRHIPDPETLAAMGRNQDEVDSLDKKEFNQIPLGAPLRPARRWKSGAKKVGSSNNFTAQIINIFNSSFGNSGGNNRIHTNPQDKSSENSWWKDPKWLISIALTMMFGLAGIYYGIPKAQIYIGNVESFIYGTVPHVSGVTEEETAENIEAKILDVSVFNLVASTDYDGTLLNVQRQWEDYAGLMTQEERALITGAGDAGEGKTWVILTSVDQYGGGVQHVDCVFGSEWRQRLLILLEDGKDKIIEFSGTIRGDLDGGWVPILKDCELK